MWWSIRKRARVRGVPLSNRTSIRGGHLALPRGARQIAGRLESAHASRRILPPARQRSYPEGSRTPSKPACECLGIPMRRSACRGCSPPQGIVTSRDSTLSGLLLAESRLCPAKKPYDLHCLRASAFPRQEASLNPPPNPESHQHKIFPIPPNPLHPNHLSRPPPS